MRRSPFLQAHRKCGEVFLASFLFYDVVEAGRLIAPYRKDSVGDPLHPLHDVTRKVELFRKSRCIYDFTV